MQTLSEYLKDQGVDGALYSIFMTLKEGMASIAEAIKISDKGKAGTENIYGEEQLALDVLSDKILQELFKKNEYVGVIASEELPDEVKLGKGEFALCFDPLDGSSNIDVNVSIGTIFSVHRRKSHGKKGEMADLLQKGRGEF